MTLQASQNFHYELFLVSDLGELPALTEVTELLTAIDMLWNYSSFESVQARLKRGTWRKLHDVPLRSRRIQLASPLEVILRATANGATPIGYIVAGMFVVERAVRLVMEWQKHRIAVERWQGMLSTDEARSIADEVSQTRIGNPPAPPEKPTPEQSALERFAGKDLSAMHKTIGGEGLESTRELPIVEATRALQQLSKYPITQMDRLT